MKSKIQEIMEVIRKENLGYQSTTRGIGCAYSADDGNKCLVGCFIPEDIYDSSMETLPAEHVITKFDLEEYMPLGVEQMGNLQYFHDNYLDDLKGEEFFIAIENKLEKMGI